MIQHADLPKQRAAQVFGLSSRGYYKWKQRPESVDEDDELREAIHAIAAEFPNYGHRRIAHA